MAASTSATRVCRGRGSSSSSSSSRINTPIKVPCLYHNELGPKQLRLLPKCHLCMLKWQHMITTDTVC
jgi:hypothetical protein